MHKILIAAAAFCAFAGIAFSGQQIVPPPAVRTYAPAPAAPANYAVRTGQGNHEVFVTGLQRITRVKDSVSRGKIHLGMGWTARLIYRQRTTAKPIATSLGYQFTGNGWHVGAALSYEYANRKSRATLTLSSPFSYESKERTYGVTLFGGVTLDQWYGKTSLFAGQYAPKTHNMMDMGSRANHVRSDKETRLALSAEVGRHFVSASGVEFTPHAGLDAAMAPQEKHDVYEPRYDEDGTFRLKRRYYYEVPVGASLSKAFFAGSWTIKPAVDATLVMALGSVRTEDAATRTGFASYNGQEWKVYAASQENWGGRFKAGVELANAGSFSMAADYTLELRKRYYDHRFGLKAGLSF